jgi:hypothetical protein
VQCTANQEKSTGIAVAYEVVYNAHEDCVHARIEGIVDLDVAHEYARAIIEQLSAHHCLRLLNDMRKASVRVSIVDIYDLPAWIEEVLKEAGVSRTCKRALIVARDFQDYKFFETVSRNHGHLLEVFTDANATGIFRNRSEARAWLGLTADTPSHPGTQPVPDAQTAFSAWKVPAENGATVCPPADTPKATNANTSGRLFNHQSPIINHQCSAPEPGLSLSSCLLDPHLP